MFLARFQTPSSSALFLLPDSLPLFPAYVDKALRAIKLQTLRQLRQLANLNLKFWWPCDFPNTQANGLKREESEFLCLSRLHQERGLYAAHRRRVHAIVQRIWNGATKVQGPWCEVIGRHLERKHDQRVVQLSAMLFSIRHLAGAFSASIGLPCSAGGRGIKAVKGTKAWKCKASQEKSWKARKCKKHRDKAGKWNYIKQPKKLPYRKAGKRDNDIMIRSKIRNRTNGPRRERWGVQDKLEKITRKQFNAGKQALDRGKWRSSKMKTALQNLRQHIESRLTSWRAVIRIWGRQGTTREHVRARQKNEECWKKPPWKVKHTATQTSREIFRWNVAEPCGSILGPSFEASGWSYCGQPSLDPVEKLDGLPQPCWVLQAKVAETNAMKNKMQIGE